MSLLNTMETNCVPLIPRRTPDGSGGSETVWSEGKGFSAVLVPDRTRALSRGEQEDAVGVYRLLTARADAPWYHMVFRSGDRTYRSISEAAPCTPAGSALDLAMTVCEQWEVG